MCLLVLALPMQGFAASTMLLCGGGHHGAAQATAAATAGHDHASHLQTSRLQTSDLQASDLQASDPHASHMHTSHVHMAAQGFAAMSTAQGHGPVAQAAATETASAGSPVPAKPAKAMGKCSACAVCCAVAFLPTTVIAFNAPAPSRAPVVVELTTRVGFVTDGPDRPPRLPLG